MHIYLIIGFGLYGATFANLAHVVSTSVLVIDKRPHIGGNVYTDRETPWTRIIEHKWFEFGKDEHGNDLPKTVISREYSSEWKPGGEPYYPVNDEKNGKLYAQYKALADGEKNVVFGIRLAYEDFLNNPLRAER